MTFAAVLFVASLQQATTDRQCIDCHKDLGEEVRNTLHERAGVGCVSCHGTDEVVKEKHKYLPTFKPGKVRQISTLCAACHEGVANEFRGSAHDELPAGDVIADDQRSTCTACHDHHATPRADRVEIMKACLKCHEEGSYEVKKAADAYLPVGELEKSLGRFSEALDRARGAAGIQVRDLESTRREAEAARTRCRNLQHGLVWDRVKKSAAAGTKLADEGRATLAARESDFGKRFTGLLVFLGLLGLSATLVVVRARRGGV
jgi:hypothetical protein